MPLIRIHNVATNEIIDREMNEEELAALQARKDKYDAEQLLLEQKNTAKTDLLAKLGITEEEAKLLLGGN